MQEQGRVIFEPFCLDLGDERLWRGQEAIRLSHKAFGVLCCLVARAGQLVTKEDLFAEVWPETVISESVLTVAIRQLRQVLGDQARAPRFIETVHRRGYRFIAPVSSPEVPAPFPTHTQTLSALMTPSNLFVGRQRELERLIQWFERAQQGVRHIALIAGEAGIGKTALVNAFVRRIAQEQELWIGHGQCVEHYGAAEAYLPVLEAIGRLGRGADGARIVSILRHYAPSWLAHLPSLSPPGQRAALSEPSVGVSPQRMVRELAEAIEVLTETRPLVLVLEDLHWSDHTTLSWLNYISRRRDPARLLVLGTYRPVDAIVDQHPIRAVSAELRQQPQGAELVVDNLSTADVCAYLAQRFNIESLPTELAILLRQYTSGRPFFLTTVVDDLIGHGVVAAGLELGDVTYSVEVFLQQIPSRVSALIERDVDGLLPDEQALLEVASIAGYRFSALAVAAGLRRSADEIEAQCATWVRQGRFIRTGGAETWPDGAVTACYHFIHALYHDVIYRRVSAGQRVRLHRQIGLRKEAGYGARAGDIAAELAMHFERGLDIDRALYYLQEAVNNALNRTAYQEAIRLLSDALGLIHNQPDRSVESLVKQEMSMLAIRSRLVMLTKGFEAPEVKQDLIRVHALAEKLEDMQALGAATESLWLFNLFRSELDDAKRLAEESIRLSLLEKDSIMMSRACESMGETAFYLGRFTHACDHMQRCLAGYDPSQHATSSFWHESASRGVLGRVFLSQAYWIQGYPDQALQKLHEARALALQLDHSMSRAMALYVSAILYLFHRNIQGVSEQADALKALAEDQGFALQSARSLFLQGWVLTQQQHYTSGIAQMWEGLKASQATGMTLGDPWSFGLIAEAYGRAGDPQRGLSAVEHALSLSSTSHERWCEAELYRVKGDLLQACTHRRQQQTENSESYFRDALDIARKQQAKFWELRAATSLARLWQFQNKRQEAYDLLMTVYCWFKEGLCTSDLQDAKALLDELIE